MSINSNDPTVVLTKEQEELLLWLEFLENQEFYQFQEILKSTKSGVTNHAYHHHLR